MRNKDVYIITCSKCGKENRYEDYSCVGRDQRERINTNANNNHRRIPPRKILGAIFIFLDLAAVR